MSRILSETYESFLSRCIAGGHKEQETFRELTEVKEQFKTLKKRGNALGLQEGWEFEGAGETAESFRKGKEAFKKEGDVYAMLLALRKLVMHCKESLETERRRQEEEMRRKREQAEEKRRREREKRLAEEAERREREKREAEEEERRRQEEEARLQREEERRERAKRRAEEAERRRQEAEVSRRLVWSNVFGVGIALALLGALWGICHGLDEPFAKTGVVWPWCWWHIKFVVGLGIVTTLVLGVFTFGVKPGERNLISKERYKDVISPLISKYVAVYFLVVLGMFIYALCHLFGMLGFSIRAFGAGLLFVAEFPVVGITGMILGLLLNGLLWGQYEEPEE